MNAKYLLEGPDGSGKTTLAAKLAKLTDVNPIHNNTPPTDERFWFTISQLTSPLTGAREPEDGTGLEWFVEDKPVVLDRSWPSEIVYSEVIRDSPVDRLSQRMFQRVSMGLGYQLILCLPSYEDCRRSWNQRIQFEQEYVVDEQNFVHVHRKYVDFLGDLIKNDFPFQCVDYTDANSTVQITLGERCPHNNMGIGSWRPGAVDLIVSSNTAKLTPSPVSIVHSLPFVDDSGWSRYLAGCLEALGVPESRLYWVDVPNMEDRRGDLNGNLFLEHLAPRRIICMGKTAAEWALDNAPGPMRPRIKKLSHPNEWHKLSNPRPHYQLQKAFYS